jgi:hypothetical protein
MFVLALCAFAWPAGRVYAQGTTTGSITGTVTDANHQPVVGASVIAVHVPSGTKYGALTRSDGRYLVPNMRAGGPYTVSVSHIGFEAPDKTGVQVNLASATEVNFTVAQRAVSVAGVTATAERSAIISPDRTGAQTQVSREALATLPTITGRLESVSRLTPQYGGTMSFAGVDNRLNNITVDGSYFNNSFGLGSTPGDRTGVAPISLAAIEQVQINIAPYDVRQGNFVGAAVNTVTRSGTNDLQGSLYYAFRNQDFYGTKAGANTFNPGVFKYHNIGGTLGGPIIKNKLFFFGNLEHDPLIQPGTNFVANTGGQTVTGNTTRVLASDLDALSTFLSSKFNYTTGGYQGYNSATPATRGLARLDYNMSDRSKLSFRYTQLNSSTDVLLSNSSSLGFGTRRSNATGLNFQNSNYQILENIKSGVAEWNSSIGTNMSNNLIAGYTYQDESRKSLGTMFPFVDILQTSTVYTSFGFEPFTPLNVLTYGTYQFQDNFSIFHAKHTMTFGVTAERYKSQNGFYPGVQSAYVYNSLADFYTDANAFLNTPACVTDALSAACVNRTTGVSLNKFQVRYNNQPGGGDPPLQPLKVLYYGGYAQDEWRPTDKLKITAGLRMDIPSFAATGFTNSVADTMHWLDENGTTVQYKTEKMPNATPLWSPRFGFNYDVTGNRSTQIRGGTGIFTGPPAYVWISNQIGNNGVLSGFTSLTNDKNHPFNPNPNAYKPDPSTITGKPASTFGLELTDPDFKFPQMWRTDLAIDQRLPFGLIATAEFLYNKDVNGIYYINANLPKSQANFAGADQRPRWTNNRIYSAVSANVVLKNESTGFGWNGAFSLERPFSNGLYIKAGYSYGVSKNTVDAGSIATGSWQSNQISGDPNNAPAAFSANSPGHHAFIAASKRIEWLSFGATTLSVFGSNNTLGNASYIFSGDANNDSGSSNDLIYIPKDASEMNFQVYTQAAIKDAAGNIQVPARTFSVADQQTAWEAYINQDEYLSSHRGQYAERNGVFLPSVTNFDVSVIQDLFKKIGGKNNGLQFRADVLNFGNLLNHNWGIGQRMVSNSPLISPSADASGKLQYRMRNFNVNNQFALMDHTYDKTAGANDVYRIQLSLRYFFNQTGPAQ